MSNRGIAVAVFVLLCGFCVGDGLYFYGRLPERVPTHFGFSGQPDAYGTKTSLLVVDLGTVGVIVVTFLGLAWLMPRIPDALINMPHKDYWLAPSRRARTMDALIAMLFWFGSLNLLLMYVVFHQSFRVALGQAATLGHFWAVMVAYIGLTIWWSIAMYRQLRRPTNEAS